jgi:hypothetical protein
LGFRRVIVPVYQGGRHLRSLFVRSQNAKLDLRPVRRPTDSTKAIPAVALFSARVKRATLTLPIREGLPTIRERSNGEFRVGNRVYRPFCAIKVW